MDFSNESALCERLFNEVEEYRKERNFEMERDEYLCTRAFEVSMQELFNRESSGGRTVCTTEKDEEKVAMLKNIISNDGYDITTRFAAFVFLFTAYRREDHPDKVRDLVDDSRMFFRRLKIYPQYDLLSIRNKGVYRKEDVPGLISMCKSVCEDNPDNVGATNAASEIIASLADRYLLDEDDMPEILNEYIARMSESIEKDYTYGNYSSFYATLGRLYSLSNQYDNGIAYLQKAIDMDTLSQRTSRTAKWYTYIDNVKLRQHIDQRINAVFSDVVSKHLNYHNEAKLVNSFRTRMLNDLEALGGNMSMEEYLETRSFEVSILQLYDQEIKGFDNPTICSKIEDDFKVSVLEKVISNTDYELPVRFAVFVFLFTAYRREGHPLKLRDYMIKYRPMFKEIGIYEQYDLLSYSYIGDFDNSSVDTYLKMCERNVERYPKHIGIINAACEVILAFAEHGLLDERPNKMEIVENYQRLMLEILSTNQDTNSSSFYGTVGRFYAQTHDYAKAKQYITKAIDTDRTNQRQTRVMTWRSIINSIDVDIALEKKQEELEKKIHLQNQEYEDKIKNIQIKQSAQLSNMYRNNIEKSTIILVLVAGFVSIILGSINLITAIPTSDYIRYMGAFAGILLIMVSALVTILRFDENGKRGIYLLTLCAILGVAMVAISALTF